MAISILGALLVMFGGVTLLTGWLPEFAVALLILVGGFFVIISTIAILQRRERGRTEPQRIEDLDDTRRRELIRGTSMHLRNMKYRYSVRYDRSNRQPFTTEVNTVILGFLPVIILDNRTDRQGYGFVAFPHDGGRWRGPGLPCGGDREEAIAHAARCVSPLEE